MAAKLRASINNGEIQNKKTRLSYNPFKDIVLLGYSWSTILQFNLSLSKNAKMVSENITLKNIASIYTGRKHCLEGKIILSQKPAEIVQWKILE